MIRDLGQLTIPPVPYADTIPEEYFGIIANADLRNLYIEAEGCYNIRVLFNEEFISEHQVPIYKANTN